MSCFQNFMPDLLFEKPDLFRGWHNSSFVPFFEGSKMDKKELECLVCDGLAMAMRVAVQLNRMYL